MARRSAPYDQVLPFLAPVRTGAVASLGQGFRGAHRFFVWGRAVLEGVLALKRLHKAVSLAPGTRGSTEGLADASRVL